MDSDVVTTNNDRLPFDVLGLVFEQYEPDFNHPLETVLDVCQSWKTMAMSLHTLWNTIDVRIGHERTFKYCMNYARKRLALSGDTLPLKIIVTITLDYFHDQPQSSGVGEENFVAPIQHCCRYKAGDLVCHILEVLAGPNGEHCQRWTYLKMDLDSNYISSIEDNYSVDYSLVRALSHPAPSLTELHIENFIMLGPILLSCPSLDALTFRLMPMPNVIDLGSVRSISFLWCYDRHRSRLDMTKLDHAIHLTTLEFQFPREQRYMFPSSLPSVRRLIIWGDGFPISFTLLNLPNLQSLSVQLYQSEDLAKLMGSPGIPFSQLAHLQVIWEQRHGISTLSDCLQELLLLTTSVVHITMNSFTFTLLVKHIFRCRMQLDIEGTIRAIAPFEGRVITFHNYNGGEEEVASLGTCSQQELIQFAVKMNALSPELPL